MNNIGLVLEGGGMRGLYTAGILDYFMEKSLYFPYVIGVSMGACNASSYISRQIGRNKNVTINYIRDPRYLGFRNIFKCKSILGIDFIYDKIPKKLEPFDFDVFTNAKEKFVIVTTDCKTGKPVYFDKDTDKDILTIIKASSSLPFISPIVKYNDLCLLDGGISDSIPIKKSIQDGNGKNIVILTRPKEYRKKPFKHKRILRKFYGKYEGIIKAIENRHNMYNSTLDYIEKLEKENKIFVIRPSENLKVGRLEKNKDKLEKIYTMGYADCKRYYDSIAKWIEA